jgi:hypothetical protein
MSTVFWTAGHPISRSSPRCQVFPASVVESLVRHDDDFSRVETVDNRICLRNRAAAADPRLLFLSSTFSHKGHCMEIHFISSVTVDDEARIAAALLAVSSCLLDQFAVAYSVRIETSDGQVFQRTHPALGAAPTTENGAGSDAATENGPSNTKMS